MRTVKGHRISFWAVEPVAGERIRRNASMADKDWGWDATCSCGWDSKTGGAIMNRIDEAVAEHKEEAADAATQELHHVSILGPNLGPDTESFHVHAVGCADIKRSPLYRRQQPWNLAVPTFQYLVEEVYSDIIGDSPDNVWSDYVGEFRVFPCTGLEA